MAHTSREPSSKVFGYPYPFMVPPVGRRCDLLLFDLQPGQFWNPAWETWLYSKHVLYPHPPLPGWVHITPDWLIRFYVETTFMRIMVRKSGGTWPIAFSFHFRLAETQWVMNELTTAAGNFAFGGSATFSFYGP